MRAVVMRTEAGSSGVLSVEEIPEPGSPGPRQLLVEVVVCGICGSDLHITSHTHDHLRAARQAGSESMVFDPERGVVMGHCATFRVLATGPGVTRWKRGDLGTGILTLTDEVRTHVIGFSSDYPGGYAERMLISDQLLAPLPDGLDPAHAVFVEPLLVGEMAVRTAAVPDGAPAVVLGTGQVGLGIVAALVRHGRAPVIAVEPSPLRREAAGKAGADVLVDPAVDTWLSALLSGLPPTVFDTTGGQGMLARLFEEAPKFTHIVSVSARYDPDPVVPGLALMKNLRVTFSCSADPAALDTVLKALVNGEVDAESWITRRVGLDGIAGAFESLRDPARTIAIVVEP